VVEPALIVGSVHDEHVQAVVAAMGDSSPVVLDAASLEEAEFLLDGNRLALHRADGLQEIGLSGAPEVNWLTAYQRLVGTRLECRQGAHCRRSRR
jgi:hypothetical protein